MFPYMFYTEKCGLPVRHAQLGMNNLKQSAILLLKLRRVGFIIAIMHLAITVSGYSWRKAILFSAQVVNSLRTTQQVAQGNRASAHEKKKQRRIAGLHVLGSRPAAPAFSRLLIWGAQYSNGKRASFTGNISTHPFEFFLAICAKYIDYV